MINNYWEEKEMGTEINNFHNEELKSWGIPNWINNIKCPFCHKNLNNRSIRCISLKLNTRNLGDIAVEIICDDCSKMDTVYFRKQCNNIEDFCVCLKEPENEIKEPVLEEDMYKLQYNNLLEKMSKGENN